MSTTMLSTSSSGRRNVASTTNVAPCSRCAGPNTSPRKLWATMMWSRTVTLNINSRSVVGAAVVGEALVADHVAQRGEIAVGQPGKYRRKVSETRLPRDHRVEDRVPQQLQGQREPVGWAAGRPSRRRHPPHLTAPDRQPAG